MWRFILSRPQQKATSLLRWLFVIWLDVTEFGFHLTKEILLLGESIARFFDELFWRLLDVVWATEARFEGFDFASEFQDTVFEVSLVLLVDILWDLEVDVVPLDGKAETFNLVEGNLRYAWAFRKVLNEKLILVH